MRLCGRAEKGAKAKLREWLGAPQCYCCPLLGKGGALQTQNDRFQRGLKRKRPSQRGYEGLHCAGQDKSRLYIYGGIQEWVPRWERDSGQKSGYKIAPSGAPGNVISAHWWEADIVEGLPACALRQNQGK